MQLAWIEDFLTLARLGSFTRAAEARGVAQSVLSRRVRALEHWAGAALIDRASHPVALTDAGRLLLPVAERAARDLAGVREQTRPVGSAAVAAVVIAAPHSVAIGLLTELLRGPDLTPPGRRRCYEWTPTMPRGSPGGCTRGPATSACSTSPTTRLRPTPAPSA